VKDDRLYLQHILDAVEKITSYASCGREEFMRNTMVQDAIVRNLEIIGEATKQLGDETRQGLPDIPWHDIARFRDVLIHHYMGVDLKRVWNVVETHLPALRDGVATFLNR
jgi:uncharacterized protein with HEPN domain